MKKNTEQRFGWRPLALLGVLVLIGPLILACTAKTAAPTAQTAAPKTIVQMAQPVAGAPAPAPVTGWETEAARKAGIKLLQTFDSSGPAAWDAQMHPMVFMTSNGPGYGGLPSANVTLPGLTIIDATTKEVIASQWYDLKYYAAENATATSASEPHSLGVSSDGKWLYLPAADPSQSADDRGRLLVIDARTLKLHQVIGTQRLPHHSKVLLPPDGRNLMLVYDFGGSGIYILDVNNDNKVVAVITDQDISGRRYLAFADPKGETIWTTVRPASGVESDGWVSIISTKDWKVKKALTVERDPVWVTFTADGKYAFVGNAGSDTYTKIDAVKQEVIGEARSGGQGPYGMALTWNEKELWFVNKGEGSHNRGKTVSYVDPIAMGRPKDEFYTGGIRGDHIYLHPDPKVNEFWITMNSSFEVVVFDPVKKVVKTRIPMPNGGSTHSGAFVQYTVSGSDWKGEVLVDHGGAHGATLAKKAELAAAAAAPKK